MTRREFTTLQAINNTQGLKLVSGLTNNDVPAARGITCKPKFLTCKIDVHLKEVHV